MIQHENCCIINFTQEKTSWNTHLPWSNHNRLICSRFHPCLPWKMDQRSHVTLRTLEAYMETTAQMTTFTQVWVLINHVYQVVLSSVLTKIVLKVLWSLDQWLGPTFPMDLVYIHAYLGSMIQDCSGFPSSTAWLCYDMQCSNCSKYRTSQVLCAPTKTDH